MAHAIYVGNIRAVSTLNNETDWYLIIEWETESYKVEWDKLINKYQPPIIIKDEELVCDELYLTPVTRFKYWYTPLKLNNTVRMMQVSKSNIEMVLIQDENQFPKNWEAN